MTDNVTPIEEARRRKAKTKRTVIEAPLEAWPAENLDLGGGAHVLSGCDGDQAYVWIADKPRRRKTFRVREVFPGLEKRRTNLRDATELDDLVFEGAFTTIEEVKDDLNAMLFEGCELEDDGDEE